MTDRKDRLTLIQRFKQWRRQRYYDKRLPSFIFEIEMYGRLGFYGTQAEYDLALRGAEAEVLAKTREHFNAPDWSPK